MVVTNFGSKTLKKTALIAVLVAMCSPIISASPVDPVTLDDIEDIDQLAVSIEETQEEEIVYASVEDKPLVRIALNVSQQKKKQKQKEQSHKNYIYELTTLINDRVHYYFSSTDEDESSNKMNIKNSCKSSAK